MTIHLQNEVTDLLLAWQQGDEAALAKLTPPGSSLSG